MIVSNSIEKVQWMFKKIIVLCNDRVCVQFSIEKLLKNIETDYYRIMIGIRYN